MELEHVIRTSMLKFQQRPEGQRQFVFQDTWFDHSINS